MYDLEAVERGYGECIATFNGSDIHLRYRADITGETLIAMRQMAGQAADGSTVMPDPGPLFRELARVIIAWDITRGGVPVPITEGELARLPIALPAQLLGSIMVDIADPNAARPSPNGSSVGAASQPIAFPTTTDSSQTPNGPGSPLGSYPGSNTPGGGRVGASG